MKRIERLLLWSSNLWYFGEGMLGPLFAVFAQRIGGTILDITWAWATFLFVRGVLMIFFGRFADKWNKRWCAFVGYVLNALFTFSYLLVSEPWHLFIVQAGIGFATAISNPSWNALYSKYQDKDKEAYDWGLKAGEANIFTAVAIVLGGFIVSTHSFTLLFVIMGCVQVVAAAYQAKVLTA